MGMLGTDSRSSVRAVSVFLTAHLSLQAPEHSLVVHFLQKHMQMSDPAAPWGQAVAVRPLVLLC